MQEDIINIGLDKNTREYIIKASNLRATSGILSALTLLKDKVEHQHKKFKENYFVWFNNNQVVLKDNSELNILELVNDTEFLIKIQKCINQDIKNHAEILILMNGLKNESNLNDENFYRERLENEHKPWSKEDDEKLMRLWVNDKLKINEIHKIFKRTPLSIEMRINKLEREK